MGNSCVCEERGKAVITDYEILTKREAQYHSPLKTNSGSVNEAYQEKSQFSAPKPVASVTAVQQSVATVQPSLGVAQESVAGPQATVASGVTVIPVRASDLPTPTKSVVVITDRDITLETKNVDHASAADFVDFAKPPTNCAEPSKVPHSSVEPITVEPKDLNQQIVNSEQVVDSETDTSSEYYSDEDEDSDDDMPVRKHDRKESPSTMAQLKLTKPAPEFTGTAVLDSDFKTISLSQYKGKYVVFFFYPLDFTFVCPTEIIAFSDRVEEFRNINCEVIGCSTDSHFSHLAWINTPRKQGGLGEMKIPLLADKTCEIAKAYGVYKEDEGIAFRGLFIIDDKGNLRQITVNDLPVGRSVDETLRLVQAFQFTDKHGEVCPAGWKPGADTMKPNPKESKSYFQKTN